MFLLGGHVSRSAAMGPTETNPENLVGIDSFSFQGIHSIMGGGVNAHFITINVVSAIIELYTICSFMLSTLSIRILTILIIIVLNS